MKEAALSWRSLSFGERRTAASVPPHHHTEAVVFDFVNPVPIDGRLSDGNGKANSAGTCSFRISISVARALHSLSGLRIIPATAATGSLKEYPPSIRPSPPGTVQGLLRRAHILSAHSTRGTMAPFKPKPRQPPMTKAELRAQGIQALAQVTTPIIKLPMKIRRQCGRCGDFNSVLVEPGQAVPAFKCSACGYAAG